MIATFDSHGSEPLPAPIPKTIAAATGELARRFLDKVKKSSLPTDEKRELTASALADLIETNGGKVVRYGS